MLTASLRLLGAGDRSAIDSVLEREPIAGAQVADLVNGTGVNWWRSGARLLGHGSGKSIDALCWCGVNMIPVGADATAAAAFAGFARAERRRSSSLVGPADVVLDMWSTIQPRWGPAREVRADQPLLLADQPAVPAPDPRVRLARAGELDVLLPAAIAMYTAEVGVSPVTRRGGSGYRRRISDLIAGGRAYVRIDAGEVVFKADLAVLTPRTAQIQGVWVPPGRRGEGLATAGVSAVLADAFRRGIPTVSLYVNHNNVPARRVYERCGFREVGRFATVLF